MKIVFIDPKCPRPYDSEVLAMRGLGGTEASVLRVARHLARDHTVTLVQRGRTGLHEDANGLSIRPFEDADEAVAGAQHVVFIQRAQDIHRLARRTGARLWVWLHNYLGDEVPYHWQDHLRHRLGLICVSRTHAEHTRRHIAGRPASRVIAPLLMRGGVTHIHNPLDERLSAVPDAARDMRKLVFFSSPHKGIEQVLSAFGRLREIDPSFRLVLADPGYMRGFDGRPDDPGVQRVGSLAHAEVIEHVRQALCVFYPQTLRPETFGLVYAEANAVGTPVLAHDFGAAREVLAPENPPIDARDTNLIIETVRRWANGAAPRPTARPIFSLDNVVTQWEALFADPDAFLRRARARLST